MPCSLLKVNRRFGGIYRLHLQGRRISRSRNQSENRWQCLPGLFFWHEDGVDIPPKRRLTFDELHGAISQNIELFYLTISCACGDSNTNSLVVQPKSCYLHRLNYSGSYRKPRPPNINFEDKWEFCGYQVQAVDGYGRTKCSQLGPRCMYVVSDLTHSTVKLSNLRRYFSVRFCERAALSLAGYVARENGYLRFMVYLEGRRDRVIKLI
jgi:hypothetical protein